jgi:hypothetical protein
VTPRLLASSALLTVAAVLACACGTSAHRDAYAQTEVASSPPPPGPSTPVKGVTLANVYAATGAGQLSPPKQAARGVLRSP